MNITLGISTSLSRFELVLFDGQAILFNSINSPECSQNKNLADVLQHGLLLTRLSPENICQIVVDIGPGGTSSVRTGVAFANGLAFALRIPVRAISSVELMGFEAWKKDGIPVLVFLKSIKNNAYVGLFDGKTAIVKHGPVELLVKMVASSFDRITLAGASGNYEIGSFLQKTTLLESGIQKANMEFFLLNAAESSANWLHFPKIAIPITEQIVECHE